MKTLVTDFYQLKKGNAAFKFNSLFLKLCLTLFIVMSGVHLLEAAETSKVVVGDKVLPMLAGLVGVLAVIFVLAFLFKKVTNLNIVSKNISVIESQNIGAKEKLVIVEVQGEQFLLGVTSHQINPICELREPIPKTESNLSFDKLMDKVKSSTHRA